MTSHISGNHASPAYCSPCLDKKYSRLPRIPLAYRHTRAFLVHTFFISPVNVIAPIYVGQLQDGVIWIRVEGKGSFQNSPELKDFAAQMIKSGTTKFVIDLENCPVMDSTFMGTLVGIVRNQGTSGESSFEILNANTRNVQLIQSLGLDQLLTLDIDGSAWPGMRHKISGLICNEEQLEHVDLDKQQNNEHVLEAHQQLSEADNNNVPRFYDVIEFLKKELQSNHPE